MPIDDLNQRVQARIDRIEVGAILMKSDIGRRMPASWRERWDRHQPAGAEGGYSRLICRTCFDAGGYSVDAPCDEAQAVLREIGIER